MTDNLQSGAHLDADQLAAFAEGALPEHERLHVLAHAAGCARCREVLFVLQEASEVPAAAPESAPWWHVWAHPWMLGGAGALAAFALLLGVFVWNRPQPPDHGTATVAEGKAPTPLAESKVSPPAAPAALPPRTQALPEPAVGKAVAGAIADAPVPPAAAPRAAAPAPSTVVVAAAPAPQLQQQMSAGMAQPAISSGLRADMRQDKAVPASPAFKPEAAGTAAPPPAYADAAPPAPVDAARLSQLPLSNRNVATMRAVKARATGAGPLRLQVEHGAGPDNGLASLSGEVLDQSGAAIPGATVSLISASSPAGQHAVTDTLGRFALPPVPAGNYQAQITAPGFDTVTQQIDLQPRDIARADTVLPVGASSEAVSISADTAEVSTDQATLEKPSRTREPQPGSGSITATVSIGDRTVILDSAGALFTRRGDRRWKKVKPRWDGAVAKLEPVPAAFQITTSAGVLWTSVDGEHWVRR